MNRIENFETIQVKLPSNRAFGALFAVVCCVAAGVFYLLQAANGWVVSFAFASVSFAAVSILKPSALSPLNRAWLKVGQFLHRFVNPVIMGFLYFVVVSPVALLQRVLGRNALRLGYETNLDSYWVERSIRRKVSVKDFDRQY